MRPTGITCAALEPPSDRRSPSAQHMSHFDLQPHSPFFTPHLTQSQLLCVARSREDLEMWAEGGQRTEGRDRSPTTTRS